MGTCHARIACYAHRMDEKRYHAIADATLMHCYDQLEDAFEAGMIDELELQGGISSPTCRKSGNSLLLHALRIPLLIEIPVLFILLLVVAALLLRKSQATQ